MEQQKCPEVRFNGFSYEWQKKEFKEIFNYERPDNYIVKSTEYSDSKKTPVLTANKGFILGYTDEIETYNKPCIIFDDFTLDSKYVDFSFMVKSSALKILTVQDAEVDDLYYSYYLLKQAKIEIMGHARHYIGIVQPTKINVAFFTEQQEISNFFQKLDRSIALHEKKLSQTQNLKKAMLEKMFPKAGSTQPEIRLKGFSGDWVESKLGDVYSFNYGKFNTNPSNGGQYPVYGANGIIGGYTDYNAESSAVIGHMGEYAGSVLWAEGKHFVTYNGTISKPKKSDFDSLFGYFMLVKMNLKKVCGGSGQPFLSYEVLERLNVLLPTLEEQTVIGQFFKQLDETLVLQQQQLQTLKNLKQAFLEKMFV